MHRNGLFLHLTFPQQHSRGYGSNVPEDEEKGRREGLPDRRYMDSLTYSIILVTSVIKKYSPGTSWRQ